MIGLLLPLIGLGLLFFEFRHHRQYQATIDQFLHTTLADPTLSAPEKLGRVQQFLDNHHYKTVKKTPTTIRGEKKMFHLGMMFLTYALYLPYYFLFQRPHVIEVSL